MKRCFSQDTAIRYLAFFMTSRAFGRSDFKQRYPDVQVIHPLNPELSSWQRGRATEYFNAHQRTVRRLRRILARKEKCKTGAQKWDAMHDRYIERARRTTGL